MYLYTSLVPSRKESKDNTREKDVIKSYTLSKSFNRLQLAKIYMESFETYAKSYYM